ncbi:hypothetical protein GIB67_001095 [Kingdonia uniflora]|uniref:25S rRNA (uridine-N(3))-methyltransferase BMT5-like domain-containing protein n=1 Tax=Kingdonia uniflora TaxID=39325 RepID=A0A7J7MGC0_9MAGN|nr:hypothetical protein GIB67_001095 [Kingdonia uniflora]
MGQACSSIIRGCLCAQEDAAVQYVHRYPSSTPNSSGFSKSSNITTTSLSNHIDSTRVDSSNGGIGHRVIRISDVRLSVPSEEEGEGHAQLRKRELVLLRKKQIIKEIWMKHYCSSHKILLVGEGDFSFSACLAKAFGSAHNMVATSLDSLGFLGRNYKNAMSNIYELTNRGGIVLHNVDATKMANNNLLKDVLFDRVIYNFPHAGFSFRDKSREVQISQHQTLVSLYLENAKKMIKKDGEIHISHKSHGFFLEWNLEALGSLSGLCLIEEVQFNLSDYPGYRTKFGYGGDGSFFCHPSKTYKFGLRKKGAYSNKKSSLQNRGSLDKVLKWYRWIAVYPTLKKLVDDMGFADFCSINAGNSDNRLIHALVELWWPSTHTFHFLCGELGFTPLDFVMLTGISFGRGRKLPYNERYSKLEEAEKMFPGITSSGMRYGNITLSYLKKLQEPLNPRLHNYDSEMDIVYARAFIAYMMGNLFSNGATSLWAGYLAALTDYDILGASGFDWGTPIMAALYRGLDEVSVLRPGKVNKSITGIYAVLEYWFFEYCRGLECIS